MQSFHSYFRFLRIDSQLLDEYQSRLNQVRHSLLPDESLPQLKSSSKKPKHKGKAKNASLAQRKRASSLGLSLDDDDAAAFDSPLESYDTVDLSE